jgi:hypothetical protein
MLLASSHTILPSGKVRAGMGAEMCLRVVKCSHLPPHHPWQLKLGARVGHSEKAEMLLDALHTILPSGKVRADVGVEIFLRVVKCSHLPPHHPPT